MKALGRKPALTPQQAGEAREMYAGPWTVRQIARYFDVSTAVIHAALNRTGAYARVAENPVKLGDS